MDPRTSGILHGCVHANVVRGPSAFPLRANFLLSPHLSVNPQLWNFPALPRTSGMCSHFTFYNHRLLNIHIRRSAKLSAGSSHKKHETQSHMLQQAPTPGHRQEHVFPLLGMKDYNLNPRSRSRFGREINAVGNLGRIIWDLTSGGFASQRSLYKIVLTHANARTSRT